MRERSRKKKERAISYLTRTFSHLMRGSLQINQGPLNKQRSFIQRLFACLFRGPCVVYLEALSFIQRPYFFPPDDCHGYASDSVVYLEALWFIQRPFALFIQRPFVVYLEAPVVYSEALCLFRGYVAHLMKALSHLRERVPQIGERLHQMTECLHQMRWRSLI